MEQQIDAMPFVAQLGALVLMLGLLLAAERISKRRVWGFAFWAGCEALLVVSAFTILSDSMLSVFAIAVAVLTVPLFGGAYARSRKLRRLK